MSLSGKISTELPVHATAEKWFHIMTKKLHHIQHVAGKIHGAKLHQGDDWHVNDSVKHWTYTLDDKYKVFNITFEAIEKDGGSAAVKWSIEYEKVSEEVHAPYGYLELYDHVTRDVDVHLLEGEKVSANKN
ncbi:hypothetical protein ACSQ67_024109 [Phaseolus vulgaris]